MSKQDKTAPRNEQSSSDNSSRWGHIPNAFSERPEQADAHYRRLREEEAQRLDQDYAQWHKDQGRGFADQFQRFRASRTRGEARR